MNPKLIVLGFENWGKMVESWGKEVAGERTFQLQLAFE